MYAIVNCGGKQYRVNEGDVLFVELLNAAEGDEITLDEVLALGGGDDGLVCGSPLVEGACVTAKVIKNGRGPKLYILKYKAKKNFKKRVGHRQPYTKLQVESILTGAKEQEEAAPAEKKPRARRKKAEPAVETVETVETVTEQAEETAAE